MIKYYLKEIKKILHNTYIYLFYEKIKNYYLITKVTGKYDKYKKEKKVFLMQTPTHGNLGDQAIVYAQIEFIKKINPGFKIIEAPYDEIYSSIKEINLIVNKDDIIVIPGGGNMGDLYPCEEYMRRFIVKKIKKCKIISFPQTMDFSNTISGKFELKKSEKIYNGNKNLILVAREHISYEKMRKSFYKTKVILTPDIVLSLDLKDKTERNGVLVCLRKDLEKSIDSSFQSSLVDEIKKIYDKVTITDTVINIRVDKENRKKELMYKWNEFKNAEVVITDRLHGMIFCAITGTPCIVFKNSNHKIETSYNDWLKTLDYIKFIETNNVYDVISTVKQLKNFKKVINTFEEKKINNFEGLTKEFKGVKYEK